MSDEAISKMKFISNSIEETIALGAGLAKGLKKGDVVALIGELGSGKTVFTKGIAKGLGVKNSRYVNSPTFVVIKEYRGRLPLYHFDLYRLDHSTSLDGMNYEEYLYGDGVAVIEWADKIRELLPKRHWEVSLSVAGESKRKIEIKKQSVIARSPAGGGMTKQSHKIVRLPRPFGPRNDGVDL